MDGIGIPTNCLYDSCCHYTYLNFSLVIPIPKIFSTRIKKIKITNYKYKPKLKWANNIVLILHETHIPLKFCIKIHRTLKNKNYSDSLLWSVSKRKKGVRLFSQVLTELYLESNSTTRKHAHRVKMRTKNVRLNLLLWTESLLAE